MITAISKRFVRRNTTVRCTIWSRLDEALCLARFFDGRADQLQVECTGSWEFPVSACAKVPTLARAA